MCFQDTLSSSIFLSSKHSEDTAPVSVFLKQYCSEQEFSYLNTLAEDSFLVSLTKAELPVSTS